MGCGCGYPWGVGVGLNLGYPHPYLHPWGGYVTKIRLALWHYSNLKEFCNFDYISKSCDSGWTWVQNSLSFNIASTCTTGVHHCHRAMGGVERDQCWWHWDSRYVLTFYHFSIFLLWFFFLIPRTCLASPLTCLLHPLSPTLLCPLLSPTLMLVCPVSCLISRVRVPHFLPHLSCTVSHAPCDVLSLVHHLSCPVWHAVLCAISLILCDAPFLLSHVMCHLSCLLSHGTCSLISCTTTTWQWWHDSVAAVRSTVSRFQFLLVMYIFGSVCMSKTELKLVKLG